MGEEEEEDPVFSGSRGRRGKRRKIEEEAWRGAGLTKETKGGFGWERRFWREFAEF